jgi:hypothetical protein
LPFIFKHLKSKHPQEHKVFLDAQKKKQKPQAVQKKQETLNALFQRSMAYTS